MFNLEAEAEAESYMTVEECAAAIGRDAQTRRAAERRDARTIFQGTILDARAGGDG